MKLKTSELTGTALDRAVATCEGYKYNDGTGLLYRSNPMDDGALEHIYFAGYKPSTDWGTGGPIIERGWIELTLNTDVIGGEWVASIADDVPDGYHSATGATPLIAAMRCYVASKLGDTVDIPEELA